MDVARHNPPTMMKPFGSYCQSARRGNIVATAGVAAIDKNGQIVGIGDIEAQTTATLNNLKLALEAAGASISDVLKVTCFITDFEHYKGFNKAFDAYFADHPPARATVRADLVLKELLIEIDAIAVVA
ncbi:reactive intermediate/imine deaminase [Rhodoligotrophos appendicifer]|uniref:RidA family protein n=1 Tax=Rhodoligotrophos appendicifer TaxID=987056 RepID=UPI0011860F17|nr:RidA family protein [Rhodoligotrophos appendicifer]